MFAAGAVSLAAVPMVWLASRWLAARNVMANLRTGSGPDPREAA
jgi:hypothetical protein